jgi:subfamily B ATP-binding cassette protein MsbA
MPPSAVNGTRMTELPRKITDDPYGAAILIRRLVMEQGAA